MKHIDSLFDFLQSSLTHEERVYLTDKLNPSQVIAESNNQGNVSVLADHQGDERQFIIKNEFQTLNKRIIRYGTIKTKVLIQKPKTLQKLNNTINQIGSGNGGFSEIIIQEIISQLILENIISVVNDDAIAWLK